jgi:DNA-binding beta-propeller fold protein YncE
MKLNSTAVGQWRRAATLVAAFATLTAPAALAAPGHGYSAQFGSPGSGPGQFSGPAGVAVRQSTGDVYVADQFNNRVEAFDGTGAFLLAFDGASTPAGAFSSPAAVAVDQVSGDVYVADQFDNAVDVFDAGGTYLRQLDPSPTPAGAFSAPAGVAVDPGNGDVYVSDQFGNAVDVYDDAGAYVTSFDGSAAPDGTPFAGPTAIAVGGDHDVYVVDPGKGQVEKYSAHGGTFLGTVGTVSPQAVAVDPSTNDVYVGGTDVNGTYVVQHLDASGTLLFTFGGGRVGSSTGIGVKASSSKVYVSDAGNGDVLVYTAFVAPDATTDPASAVTTDGATLNGTVGTSGIDTSYSFNYGIDATYGSSTPVVDLGTSGGPVSEAITGLSPNTTYHYELVATNAQGANAGEDQTFTTAAAPPLVDGQPAFAAGVTDTTARLHGTVNPNGSATTYRFEYGTTTAYGNSAPSPDGDGGAGLADEDVSAALTGLQANTQYHFRIVADNGTGGPQAGADQTFTTALAPPSASAALPSDVTTTSATLRGTIDAHGVAGATYRFVVAGAGVPYDGATAWAPVADATGPVQVSAPLAGLPAAASFTVRLDVVDAAGSGSSDPVTFQTAAAPAAPFPASPPVSAAPYGCAHPHLDTYNKHPKPGQAVTITGSDLGVGGTVVLDGTPAVPDRYTAAGFTVAVPEGARGTLSVTVDCGTVSNTIGVVLLRTPSSTFTTSLAIRGPLATLSVKVPGPGTVRITGSHLVTATAHPTRAGTVRLHVRLTTAGIRALSRAHGRRLTATAAIRFTPAGGRSRTSRRTLVFRRAA